MTDTENILVFQPGTRFKVVTFDGKPLGGLLGSQDIVKKINPVTGKVIGEFVEADHEICRVIRDQPEQLKKQNIQSK